MTVFNCECDDDGSIPRQTLAQLRRRMLIRLGYGVQADNPPPGVAITMDDYLQSAQEVLWRQFPSLRTERFFTWTCVQGEPYYDLPENDEVIDETCLKTLDPTSVTWVGVQDQFLQWSELGKGIPPEFYTSVERTGMPQRYEIRQCLEVFPAPSSDQYKIRVKGRFGLERFTQNTDKTTIHSEVVFLWALANAKNEKNFGSGDNDARQARSIIGSLTAGAHQTARYVPGSRPLQPAAQPIFLPLEE